MPTWKKNIFLRVLRSKMDLGLTLDEALLSYPLLTPEEIAILREELTVQ